MSTVKKKILYVDDEAINVELFRINFMKHYDVLTAFSGQNGLDVLSRHGEVHAIISDMKMPQMHGVDFIKAAKGLFPDTPCFILTGYDITPEISDALTNQLIIRYFQKPMDVQVVRSAIAEVA